MLEGLVGRDIVRTPREVGCSRWLHTRTCRACDGCDVHLVAEQLGRGKRQQRQLNGCSKATWVGNASSLANLLALHLCQSVDKTIVLVAEVLRQVDNLQVGRHLVLLHKLGTRTVSRAEKQHVDGLQVVLRRKAKVALAIEPSVHLAHKVARVACRVNECNLHLRMVDEQTNQLACGVTRTAYDTNLNHYFAFFFWLL